MKIAKNIILCCVLALTLTAFYGCGKKADENKSVADVKAEAEKMSVEKLKSMAVTYQDAITAKKADVDKLASKLKDIPLTKLMGSEAKKLKAEVDELKTSVSALKERFDIYYNKLKEKGGDLSGLKL
jgi:hypothetical protein